MRHSLARQAARIHYHVFLGLPGRTAPFGIFDRQRIPCKNWRDVHWSFRFARTHGYTVIRVQRNPWYRATGTPDPRSDHDLAN